MVYRAAASSGSIAVLFAFLLSASSPGSAQVYPHAVFIACLAVLAFGYLDAEIEYGLVFAFAGVSAFNCALLDWVWGVSDAGAFFSAVSWTAYVATLFSAGLIADRRRSALA